MKIRKNLIILEIDNYIKKEQETALYLALDYNNYIEIIKDEDFKRQTLERNKQILIALYKLGVKTITWKHFQAINSNVEKDKIIKLR